jgi:hypothetical protein
MLNEINSAENGVWFVDENDPEDMKDVYEILLSKITEINQKDELIIEDS